MANWSGTSRSNYVQVKDVDAALAALEPFGTDARRHPTRVGYIGIFGNDDDGSFNTTDYDSDREIEWSEWASTHLCEGQVLILVSVGAEKLRYVSAWASAFDWRGQEVQVDLQQTLYQRILAEFGINPHNLAEPIYTKCYPEE